MQDRFQQNFSERARQSRVAKLANLEAFRAALAPNSQENIESTIQAPEIPSIVATASTESNVSSDPKSLLRWVPRKARTPLLAATAGIAALGAAACTSGNSTEVPQAPTNQGEVLGAYVTPVPNASTESRQQNQTEQYKKAPDFTLNDANGNPVSLHDFAGRNLIMEFAEGGCPPCNFESKKLGEFMKTYGIAGLNISRERDGNFSSDVPVLLDPNMKVADLYNVAGGVPVTIFVNSNGEEVFRYRGYSQDNNDLGLLVAAFAAGKDLNNVLPTPTPEPSPTPFGPSNPDLESDVGSEAVVDLGNYDFAVTKWQDLGVQPGNQVRSVVMEGIIRNKTNNVIGLDYFSSKFAEGYDIWFLDNNGRVITPFSSNFYLPIGCGGLFNDPFEKANNGKLTSVASDYQKDCLSQVTSFMAPGFGLPVALVIGVPQDAKNIEVAFDSQRDHTRQIVRQGQVDSSFPLISENATFSSLDETLHVNIPGNLATDLEYKVEGFTKAKLPNSAQRDVAVIRVVSHSVGMKGPFGLFRGELYLKDGRVIPLANDYSLQIAPGESQPFGLAVGQLDPDKAFETRAPGSISPSVVADAYKFDLKGSTLVVFAPGANPSFRAWKMPDTLNAPIGQGGE